MPEAHGGRTELLRALAVLAEPPSATHVQLSALLGLPGTFDSAKHADVFLFQLYPYASVHLGPEGMMGGEARERVAGCWRALGLNPPAEPDHLTALIGLYTSLTDRAGEASGAEAALLREAARGVLDEHVAPWAFHLLSRVGELAPEPFGAWAELLGATLRDEVAGGGRPRRLPAHLASAPPLPDPRRDGAADFVAGLLAPVRSGMILARADLARVAAAADVGLRAGERRYALEHLLAQDARRVLSAIAVEARRQAALHGGRADWLGPVSDFYVTRALATSELLEELAAEDMSRGVPAPAGETATAASG